MAVSVDTLNSATDTTAVGSMCTFHGLHQTELVTYAIASELIAVVPTPSHTEEPSCP